MIITDGGMRIHRTVITGHAGRRLTTINITLILTVML